MTVRLRPELGALPSRLQRLPIDARGYPVPWFVAWEDGRPEFRAMDPNKFRRAVRDRLCWVCGDQLGRYVTFVAGPMCGINRTSSEPPCHGDCAEWSARNCPFLSRPRMVRREDGLPNLDALRDNVAGIMLDRNPGVAMLWTTRAYRVFNDGRGNPLLRMGDPTRVEWFAQGRRATRDEVETSITSGLPFLLDVAEQQDRDDPRAHAVAELHRKYQAFEQWVPVLAT
jgi:hypothetical protein